MHDIGSVSSIGESNNNTTIMDQWLAMQEDEQQDSTTSTDLGSVSFQMEMSSAFNDLMSGSNDVQGQQETNAQQSGNQSPVNSF
jgi:hypothetical protein